MIPLKKNLSTTYPWKNRLRLIYPKSFKVTKKQFQNGYNMWRADTSRNRSGWRRTNHSNPYKIIQALKLSITFTHSTGKKLTFRQGR